jgi:uncharacterized membrane protein YdjX (TVP38/TMEM64 family)
LLRSGQVLRRLWGKLTGVIRRPTRPTGSLLAVALGIAVAAALTFSFDLGVGLEILRAHHGRVLSFVVEAPALASILFITLYAGAVAISLPGVAILTVVAGYLFGWFHGTALVLIGASAGASGVFLLARSALGSDVRARAAPAVQRLAEGFRRNALSRSSTVSVGNRGILGVK